MSNLIEPKIISGQKVIQDYAERKLNLVEIDNSNWTMTYIEKNCNVKWLCFNVGSENHGGGFEILCKLPIPDTEELIDIVLNSAFENEVIAACNILLDNENIKKEDFRLTLINRLEKINNSERQLKVIKLTDLTSSLNRRNIFGKSIAEIELDSMYFEQISERANKLK